MSQRAYNRCGHVGERAAYIWTAVLRCLGRGIENSG